MTPRQRHGWHCYEYLRSVLFRFRNLRKGSSLDPVILAKAGIQRATTRGRRTGNFTCEAKPG